MPFGTAVQTGCSILAMLASTATTGWSQETEATAGSWSPAPPANPPFGWRADPPGVAAWTELRPAGVASMYSIGEPTDEEQLYVEFINRARANPPAEGRRLVASGDVDTEAALRQYQVDRALVIAQFDAIAAAPPVSLQGQLIEAARRHSRDMLENGFQAHVGSDGSSSARRIEEAGYRWSAYGENVYAYAKGVWHGHAGFNVDWGLGPGGIQDPPGHRRTIHHPMFREVGIGVVLGTNGDFGPQAVTQEFASRSGLTPFVTGVVYYDFNGNQFYDLGEGIGGVTVRVSSTSTYAVTARSGGYSVPVGGDGTYTVTFQVPGREEVRQTVAVSGGANSKVDHTPVYAPPVLGGASVAYLGRDNRFAFSAVGAATAYDWRSRRREPWTAPEGAESGLGRLEASVSGSYNVISTTVRQSGAAAFHLAHPSPQAQTLSVKRPIWVGAGAELTFGSRLAVATPDQVARVQVSTDDGRTWQDLWTQAGSEVPGETGFQRRQVSLGSVAGKLASLRFVYAVNPGGRYYLDTGDGVGWYLDDIQVSPAEELVDESVSPVSVGQELVFRPAQVGDYLLEVRARIGDRVLPWGTPRAVSVEIGGPEPPSLRILEMGRNGGGDWEIRFRLESGEVGLLEVETTPEVSGPWAVASGSRVEAGAVAGEYRAVAPAGNEARRFYRITSR